MAHCNQMSRVRLPADVMTGFVHGKSQVDWNVVVAAIAVHGAMRDLKSSRASDFQDVLHESSSLTAPAGQSAARCRPAVVISGCAWALCVEHVLHLLQDGMKANSPGKRCGEP